MKIELIKIQDKSVGWKVIAESDDDKKILISTFYSIYPNVKTAVDVNHAISTIKNIQKDYYGKRKKG